jgi:hypothetical protein
MLVQMNGVVGARFPAMRTGLFFNRFHHCKGGANQRNEV